MPRSIETPAREGVGPNQTHAPAVFDEQAYLTANPDVAAAVESGAVSSGRFHFESVGRAEGRPLGLGPEAFMEAKREKLARIAPLLRSDSAVKTPLSYDFLTDDLRSAHGIDTLGPESSHNYDGTTIALLDRCRDDLVLDVGAGRRSVYYKNVVNLEISPYLTTDVRAVAEELPFESSSFAGVVSIAVLEHVRDPFRAASEMIRVLKPGGELVCCVPFLQPLHGYPHHYYNMTHEGLRNLFDGSLQVDRVFVSDSTLPIWSLTWILQSWTSGLSGGVRETFLNLSVRELLNDPPTHLDKAWVRDLDDQKNLELASACVLVGRKKA